MAPVTSRSLVFGRNNIYFYIAFRRLVMPILHTINKELGVVLSSLAGDISDADLLSSYKELYESECWQPGFHEIVDLRNAQMGGVTSDGLRRVSSMVESFTKGKCEEFKTAFIAPDDLPFGIARMYEVLSSETPENVMVFRDLNKAFKWLEIEDPLLE